MDVVAAEVVVPCADLGPTLEFFTNRLGFRVEQISPADDPVAASISGHGVRLRLDRHATGAPGILRLRCSDATVDDGHDVLTAPNGTIVELVPSEEPMVVPPLAPSLVVSKVADAAGFGSGRAGMQYRDLIPDRQGGRFIASHIRIPDGGPVPDYVHYHRIGFQLIYCARGWVEVVYEDQGEPFVMHAGDCVLQPPLIRHRVLNASAGMEVVEVGSPAVHDTYGDLDMTLPTGTIDPTRDFGGQQFVRHVAADATWVPSQHPGLEVRETGLAVASNGAVGARVLRATHAATTPARTHDGELLLMFVLAGETSLRVDADTVVALGPSDSVVVPPHEPYSLMEWSQDLEVLEVTVPGAASAVAA